MRCAKCDLMAAIRMRQHRLSFCREHFLEWFIHHTAETIRKYRMFSPAARVLVAVSGGKDSLSLWDALIQLGYQTEGVYINLGIAGNIDYSNASQSYAQRFADQNGVNLRVVDLASDYHHTIPELSASTRRGNQRPCSLCGLAKRHILNRAALEGGFDVLVTAHNLDDEVAVLFGNTLAWQVDLLARQSPVLPAAPGFARKAKPFCRFYERETAAYALVRGIEFIEDECPYSEGSKQLEYKAILNKIEEQHPGTKINFYAGFQNARARFLAPTAAETAPEAQPLCPNCGQMTTRQGLCAFCQVFTDNPL